MERWVEMADNAPSPFKVYMSMIVDNPLAVGPKRADMPEETPTIERWKRIAYLIWCNYGSFEVRQWGIIDSGDFPWKQGLTQPEALELIYVSGVVNASVWYESTFADIFQPLINQYIEQMLAFQKKHSPHQS
jgi:hypothetical protein